MKLYNIISSRHFSVLIVINKFQVFSVMMLFQAEEEEKSNFVISDANNRKDKLMRLLK